MRGVVSIAVVTLTVVACSSSSSGPDCKIEGSYSASASAVTGNCPQGNGAPVVDTITARPAGASGPDFVLQITGVQGGCDLNRVAGETCKVQGQCDVIVADALDPSNNTGTTQYSWTFDAQGFHGTSTVSVPPAKSLPKGCSEQATVTGTRQ